MTMQNEDTQVPADDQSTAPPEEASSESSGNVSAAQAADDTFLVQSLTVVAFAVMAMSFISPTLFG